MVIKTYTGQLVGHSQRARAVHSEEIAKYKQREEDSGEYFANPRAIRFDISPELDCIWFIT